VDVVKEDCPSDTTLEMYLYEDLPYAQMAKVRAHMVVCHSCQKRLCDLRKFNLSLANVPYEEPPAELAENIGEGDGRVGRRFSPYDARCGGHPRDAGAWARWEVMLGGRNRYGGCVEYCAIAVWKPLRGSSGRLPHGAQGHRLCLAVHGFRILVV